MSKISTDFPNQMEQKEKIKKTNKQTKGGEKIKPKSKKLYFKNDRGNFVLNINVLVTKYLKEYHIIRCHERLYIYDSSQGIWIYKTDRQLKREIAIFCNELKENLWKRGYREDVFEELSIRIQDVDELETYTKMICLKNGVLDLSTGKLLEFSPIYYFIHSMDYSYLPEMKCPTYKSFMKSICNGKKERIMALEELLGYCLTCDNSAQKIAYFFGDGRNGKSTFISLLESIVGSHSVCSTRVKELENPFVRAKLENRKVLLLPDISPSESSNLVTGEMKKIVSGDAVSIDHKHGAIYDIHPYIKAIVASNHTLSFEFDNTLGATRRIQIFIFDHYISDEELDTELENKLKAEIPAILKYALRGYQRLVKNHYVFSNSAESKECLEKILTSENPLKSFVKKCIVKDTSNKVSNLSLMNAYHEWCRKEGIPYHAVSAKAINQQIEKMYLVSRYKTGSERGIKGIRIL